MPIFPAESRKDPLSERLRRLARAVPEGARICDVGSDHALLPLALLSEGAVARASVTDLRPLPLRRAEKAIREAGFADRAAFFLCDGIPPETAGETDVYIVAGMGGETIAHILETAPPVPPGTRFFLQPMTHEADLRRTLSEKGFFVEREEVASENGKVFLLLFCLYDGVPRRLTEDELLFGEARFAADPGRQAYYRRRLAAWTKKRRGLEKAGLSADEAIRRIRTLKRLLGENDEDQ